MPPPTSKMRKAGRRKKKSSNSSTVPTSNNVEDILTQARQLEESGRIEEAIVAFEQIVAMQPTNPELQEELASFYMQSGQPDGAEKCLRSAIKLRPDEGFEKFAYLAQLLGNTEEALSFAKHGVELIRAELTRLDVNRDTNRMMELREYEASAQCAIAEIALSIIEESNDPAVANAMDTQVEHAVLAALAASEDGSMTEVEATLTLANLRLSQGRKGEAHTAMQRILNIMSDSLAQLDEEGNEEAIVHALESLPPMEIRIAIGKQLIEVELWNAAVNVLSSIMWECDFNVEVWYMLAVAYWKQGDIDEARNALEMTRKALHNPEGYDGTLDEDMITKLFEELMGNSTKANTTSSDNNNSSMHD